MFCNNDCKYLDKKEDRCTRFANKILPRNIYNERFKCEECLEEEMNNESKNKIRNNY